MLVLPECLVPFICIVNVQNALLIILRRWHRRKFFIFDIRRFGGYGKPTRDNGRRPVFMRDLGRGSTLILPNDEAGCFQNSSTFRGSGFPLDPALLLRFLILFI